MQPKDAIYYPYIKQTKMMVFPAILFGCFGICFGCIAIASSSILFGIFAFLVFLIPFILHFCMRSVKSICVDMINDEVVFIDRGENAFQHRSIDDYPYAYSAPSIKGHLYIILSPHMLSSDVQKRLATQCSLKSRLCIDKYIVIYVDFSPQSLAFAAKIKAKYPGFIDNIA